MLCVPAAAVGLRKHPESACSTLRARVRNMLPKGVKPARDWAESTTPQQRPGNPTRQKTDCGSSSSGPKKVEANVGQRIEAQSAMERKGLSQANQQQGLRSTVVKPQSTIVGFLGTAPAPAPALQDSLLAGGLTSSVEKGCLVELSNLNLTTADLSAGITSTGDTSVHYSLSVNPSTLPKIHSNRIPGASCSSVTGVPSILEGQTGMLCWPGMVGYPTRLTGHMRQVQGGAHMLRVIGTLYGGLFFAKSGGRG
ncbi:hypothetical protein NDU88_004816 [Pleurodeles waltl]|uniref:Uncharacterized protein n=1 Tax=Pleurodeles waltl TaxID=8319 RepID=A0AAV7RM24_PLEWA|nr:hypothetical protein NDU88_004816 [Pleurodeles waltl]